MELEHFPTKWISGLVAENATKQGIWNDIPIPKDRNRSIGGPSALPSKSAAPGRVEGPIWLIHTCHEVGERALSHVGLAYRRSWGVLA